MRLGHAVGVERLELVELLAGTREQDRLADDLLHRQRRAAPRVAVDLGEDDAVEADRVVERLRDVHRFLTGHRVDDEQRVVRFDRGVDRAQLVHQVGVDLQTTRGVDDDDVASEAVRFFDRVAGDADRIGRFAVERNVDAAREHAQLLDRGRALQVGADEQRLQALRLQQPRELARGGRLAGALEPGEHHARSAASGSSSSLPVVPPSVSTSSSCTILMNCWPGSSAFDSSAPTARSFTRAMNALTTRTLTSASSSASRISREISSTSRLGQPPAVADLGENAVETVAQGVEHRRSSVLAPQVLAASGDA